MKRMIARAVVDGNVSWMSGELFYRYGGIFDRKVGMRI